VVEERVQWCKDAGDILKENFVSQIFEYIHVHIPVSEFSHISGNLSFLIKTLDELCTMQVSLLFSLFLFFLSFRFTTHYFMRQVQNLGTIYKMP
jgi:hypothetical protein